MLDFIHIGATVMFHAHTSSRTDAPGGGEVVSFHLLHAKSVILSREGKWYYTYKNMAFSIPDVEYLHQQLNKPEIYSIASEYVDCFNYC